MKSQGARPRRRLIAFAGLAVVAATGLGVIVAAYVWPIDGGSVRAELEPRRIASVTVLDADGGILRQLATAAGGRESWVPLERIAPELVQATMVAEDHRFWSHPGVDVLGVIRAAWLDLRAGRAAYGGSTLTMQLVRMTAGGAPHRSWWGKAVEAVQALRLERVLSKREILEQYLNRAYYGHGAWGVEAAAQLYFGRSAASLSLGEASLLAVLPRGPELYDPWKHLPRTLERRNRILARLEHARLITPAERTLAVETPLRAQNNRPTFAAPHFVDHVLQKVPATFFKQASASYGGGVEAKVPGTFRTGATIRTTLDRALQERLEVAVAEHLASMRAARITQAGLVVVRNRDGAILSMVGSGDYFDGHHAGAVNVTTLRRRPGSTLKPFVYALALERGDTAATLAWDVVLPHEARESWARDVKQHGFARYREALAGSFNLAAVHTLERVGVGALLDRLQASGLTTLDRPAEQYGLTLAIGEAEVTLLELTGAFAAFGNQGTPVAARAIADWETPGEKVPGTFPRTEEPVTTVRQREVPHPRVFSPEVAWILFDILADPEARRPMFGDDCPTSLAFPVALKTGTTRAYTDNLALGTTREFTVGVWAGNFDGSPTRGVMAMQGAAPLVRAAFVALAARFGAPRAPERPASLAEAPVCAKSGARPGPYCESVKREFFSPGTTPAHTCEFHRQHRGESTFIYPPPAKSWARATGRLASAGTAIQPSRHSTPKLRILAPVDGARFLLDPHRSPKHQRPPLRASPGAEPVWTIDDHPANAFLPTPGRHVIRASLGQEHAEVSVWFD